MSANNIPAGLKVPTQTPLDAKVHVASQAVLSNLGTSNNLAFTYYEGMIVYCVAEKTRWEWREVGGTGTKLLVTDFTYPNNLVVDGVTYSNRIFNFYQISVQGPLGSGTLNYVARWTPDGNTLGTGLIRDNGVSTAINLAPSADALLKLYTTTHSFGNYAINTRVSSDDNIGIKGVALSSTNINIGVQGIGANKDNVVNIGVNGIGRGNNDDAGTAMTIGGKFEAYDTSLSNSYAVQLYDGSQGVGKFLKSITTDGHANWANIVVGDIKSGTSTLGQVITSDGAGNSTWTTPTSSGLSGSGTNNYVAKWTPNGTQLGDSQIRDDGNTVGVNVAPNSGVQFFVTSTKNIGIYSTMTGTGDSIGVGTYINGASTRNVGIEAQVTAGSKNIGLNLGVAGPLYVPFTNFDHGIVSATRATGKGNIGGYFIAEGGTSNYALALKDGTEGIGKVLTCATNDGKANWADPTTPNLQKVITTSYALTDVDDGYTIFINNNTTPISISLGTITIANFCVGFIQEGSADVTFVGVTNPIGLKSKGQGYQTFIERKLSTATYYLLGNTKV
jgi:hypothetical protein